MVDNRIVDCLSGFLVLAETSVKKSQASLTVVLGLVMASKGKGHKSGRGRGAASESEDFELEDDRLSGEPHESRPAYRRLPFGVHRYDLIHPPVPPAGTNRQALVDELIDQLPMLTEKGLRELNLALSHELGYRGDVREGLQEQREMDRAMEAREVPEFGATSSRGHDDVEEEPVEMEPRRRNRWNWEEEGDDGTRRHGTAERS